MLDTSPTDTVRSRHFNALWRRSQQYLGVDIPIIAGAMTWISERHLVSAVANAGGFGLLAAGALTPEQLAEEIIATKARTKKPFGVNIIVMHPQLEGLADTCLTHNISHIVLAGGLPPRAIVEKLRRANTDVMTVVSTLALARKVVRSGITGLIIEGMEAGGHIGPVSTNVLIQEILLPLAKTDVPIFVAGGIGRGEMIAHYLQMGAAGCQIGTLFACAEESIAHTNFKRALFRAPSRDAQPSVQLDSRFPVIPVRAITNEASQLFIDKQRQVIGNFNTGKISQIQGQLAIEHFWAGALKRAVVEGDVKTGSLMAGQSVGLVREERPVGTIINDLVNQITSSFGKK